MQYTLGSSSHFTWIYARNLNLIFLFAVPELLHLSGEQTVRTARVFGILPVNSVTSLPWLRRQFGALKHRVIGSAASCTAAEGSRQHSQQLAHNAMWLLLRCGQAVWCSWQLRAGVLVYRLQGWMAEMSASCFSATVFTFKNLSLIWGGLHQDKRLTPSVQSHPSVCPWFGTSN